MIRNTTMLVAVLFTVSQTCFAQQLSVEHVATYGEANAPAVEDDGRGDRFRELHWISDAQVLIIGSGDDSIFARCVAVADGSAVWEQRFDLTESDISEITVSDDRTTMVVSCVDAPLRGQERDGEPIAVLYDTTTGERCGQITYEQVVRTARRDRHISAISTVRAGPTREQLFVLFFLTEEDLRPNGRGGEPGADGGRTYGTRAYLLNLNRRRIVHRYRVDPPQPAFMLTVHDRYLGYAWQNTFCVYDARAERDQVIAGAHIFDPDDAWFAIDGPSYGTIQVDADTAVVTRNSPVGASRLIVVSLNDGQILANHTIEAFGLGIDTDFDNQRIAVIGSERELMFFDYHGHELARLDDVHDSNFFAVFSPGGDLIAVVGLDGVLQIYSVSD